MLYPCKSGWNLPTSSWDMVHTSTFGLKCGSLSPTVTLKIRSRSPKSNQLFIMSQCYIHANLVKIHSPVHEISCKQESVTSTPTLTPTPTGSAPKTICPGHLQVIARFYTIINRLSQMWLLGNLKWERPDLTRLWNYPNYCFPFSAYTTKI